MALSNGLALSNSLDVTLWVSKQEGKLRIMEEERKSHFLKITLVQSEYPRMIDYYSHLMLKNTKLLEEAQEKKRMV